MARNRDGEERRVLVAGIGNIFFADDGFGVEVARRLADRDVPAGVTVADFGIRGMHLAYAMLDGAYDQVIFVDALPQGARPGTVVVIEPAAAAVADTTPDAHAMTPVNVLALLQSIGGEVPPVLVVGCEPATVEPGMGLSAEVTAAVDQAVSLVMDLVGATRAGGVRH